MRNSTPVKQEENEADATKYYTPEVYQKQLSNISGSSTEDYKTPDESLDVKTDLFSQKFNELQKSSSTSLIELTVHPHDSHGVLDQNRSSLESTVSNKLKHHNHQTVAKSRSEFEIPRVNKSVKNERNRFVSGFFKNELSAFLTPILKRKNNQFKAPNSPILPSKLHSLPETRTTSLNSLRSGTAGNDGQQMGTQMALR